MAFPLYHPTPPMLPAAPIPSVVLHAHCASFFPGDASDARIVFGGLVNEPPAKHLLAWFRAHGYSVRPEYLPNISAAQAKYPSIILDVGSTIRADAERI